MTTPSSEERVTKIEVRWATIEEIVDVASRTRRKDHVMAELAAAISSGDLDVYAERNGSKLDGSAPQRNKARLWAEGKRQEQKAMPSGFGRTALDGRKEAHYMLQNAINEDWLHLWTSRESFHEFRRKEGATTPEWWPEPYNPGDLPFLQKDHEEYSQRLALAVRCWRELFEKNKFPEGKSSVKAIETWISKNSEISPGENAGKAIVSVVNPDHHRRGGRPKGVPKKPAIKKV